MYIHNTPIHPCRVNFTMACNPPCGVVWVCVRVCPHSSKICVYVQRHTHTYTHVCEVHFKCLVLYLERGVDPFILPTLTEQHPCIMSPHLKPKESIHFFPRLYHLPVLCIPMLTSLTGCSPCSGLAFCSAVCSLRIWLVALGVSYRFDKCRSFRVHGAFACVCFFLLA